MITMLLIALMMIMKVTTTMMMFSVAGRRGVPLPHQADDEGGLQRRQMGLASGLWVLWTVDEAMGTLDS